MMLLRRLLPLALPLVLGATALGCSAEADGTDDPGESEDNLVATFDKKGAIDLTKPSRILLVGDSDKLGNLPLFAATGKARRYAQLYPNDQIVLFVTQDAKAVSWKALTAACVAGPSIPSISPASQSTSASAVWTPARSSRLIVPYFSDS